MEYTEQQKAEFRRSYSERRRRQLIASVPVVALILALGFTEDRAAGTILGMSSVLVGSAFFVVVLGVLAFSYRNWRCPACERYLGRGFNPKFCPSCGVSLRA